MFVTTFFSYKGGVGRTMALVNVAALLAAAGRRVLVVDFDLEAPGVPSYGPLGDARGLPGIVDYVTEFRATRSAPAVEGFIVECRMQSGHPIWVLPAGDNSSPSYSDRLSSIDWNQLYDDEEGFLMFEDMRRQWQSFEGKGFDYVLIDSRTGHTDVGGICTRQLPDAVVVMFVPTIQNVDGLEPIVGSIRQASTTRDKPIDLLFCPSNVPDQYDEDETLGKLLDDAAERLRYGKASELQPMVTRIHHWTNMDLLQQPIVVETRPRSRLAKEYSDLKKAIISANPEDREGAVIALQRMTRTYEAARTAVDGRGEVAKEILRRAKDLARMHSNDGEIAFMAAELFSAAGDLENEELCLGTAIERQFKPSRAQLLRAAARSNLNKHSEALQDIRDTLSSPSGTSFEFRPAVQLLRAIARDPVEEALEIFSMPTTRPRAKIEMAQLLTQGREHMPLVADEMARLLGSAANLAADQKEDVKNAAVLALIGAGRFAEALALTNPDDPAASTHDLFNGAMAAWGEQGRAPTHLFKRLDERLHNAGGDANLFQCLAIVHSVVGRRELAMDDLSKALARVVPSGLIFSCWTFTHKQAADFLADIQEMMGALRGKAPLTPPFLKGDSTQDVASRQIDA